MLLGRPGSRGDPGLCDFPLKGGKVPPSPPRRPKGGAEPLSRAGDKEAGVGARSAPSRRPPAPWAEWCVHWPDGLRAPPPLAGRLEKHAATVAGGQSESGGQAGQRTGGGRPGQRAGGMAGAGLRATARRLLLCRGHSGPRAASSSPSCPGCGPPGPGAHCPSTPRSAPADGADLSAHLWARYQDMRRLVHGG